MSIEEALPLLARDDIGVLEYVGLRDMPRPDRSDRDRPISAVDHSIAPSRTYSQAPLLPYSGP